MKRECSFHLGSLHDRNLEHSSFEEGDPDMLNHMQRVAAAEPKSPPSSMPAPRVRVRLTGAGPAIEPTLGEAANPDTFRAAFLSAFGTVDELVAEALFTQLLNGLHTNSAKAVDSATANLALALMHEIAPKDVVEAMLTIQMIIAHVAAMAASQRAFHVEQTAGGRAVYLGLTRKLMTLFIAQMDALNRHRGKGTTQKIVIERVLVAPGAQAIVGAVANGGQGDGSSVQGQKVAQLAHWRHGRLRRLGDDVGQQRVTAPGSEPRRGAVPAPAPPQSWPDWPRIRPCNPVGAALERPHWLTEAVLARVRAALPRGGNRGPAWHIGAAPAAYLWGFEIGA